MKNIPIFTTEYGVASLTLEKIPYTAQAYVVIQDSAHPDKLLKECVAFCCAAGAESVYASGASFLEAYPLHTAIVSMSRKIAGLPPTDAMLQPVRKETLSTWRDIYNARMQDVSHAAFLSIRDSERLLQEGNCYFVYKGNVLLGIGVTGENMIKAVASAVPGGGKDTLLALCGALHSDAAVLEVAENNAAAIRLYNSLGFTKSGIVSRWYKIK